MWSENGNMYQRSLSGGLGFHCLCSFGSLIHLETQSFPCRIYKSWCALSSIPLASGNATQDSKAIVECKIRWLTATQNMCHFVSFFAWKVKLSYCNEDNKPKSRSISSSVALHWNLLLSPLIFAAGAPRCPMDGYLHLGIKGQNHGRQLLPASTSFPFWGWKISSRHLGWLPASKARTRTRNALCHLGVQNNIRLNRYC